MSTVELFGLDFWKDGLQSAVSALQPVIWSGTGSAKVGVTLNVDNVVKVHNNPQLLEQFRRADFVFPDGFPVLLSARMFGKRIRERVTGADLFQAVCRILADRKGKTFILGGRPGSETDIQERLSKKYRDLQVLAYSPPFGFTADCEEAKKAVDLINAWRPQVVFVCVGMPKQEKWTFKHLPQLRTNLGLCLGAALDFELGVVRRAPRFLQKVGFEWLWRLCLEPRRLWKRYLIDDAAFLGILLREMRTRPLPPRKPEMKRSKVLK